MVAFRDAAVFHLATRRVPVYLGAATRRVDQEAAGRSVYRRSLPRRSCVDDERPPRGIGLCRRQRSTGLQPRRGNGQHLECAHFPRSVIGLGETVNLNVISGGGPSGTISEILPS